MSSAGSRPAARTAALVIGGAALAACAVVAVFAPAAAARGWLIGFVFVGSVSLGSLAVVLIQRLTGGRWGRGFAPELLPAASATPVLLLYVLPVLFSLRLIYPWAGAGAAQAAVPPDVRRLFLNPALFWIASLIALGGWSALAMDLRRIEGPRGRLIAGLGLAFHGIALSIVAVYWVMSVVPTFTSSDFGMGFAVQQLGAGFAWAALQGRRRAADAPSGDLAGLLFACILGLGYLEFMSYLVVWYGDRPPLDAWYLTRARAPWRMMLWGSAAFGAAGVVLLIARRVLGAHRTVAWVGLCVLAGVFGYQAWLLAPSFGAACLGPAVLAALAQGGLWIALTGGAPRLRRRARGLAHAG